LVICAARVNSFIHDKVDNMTFDFQELDYQVTPLGDISLRRRSEPRLGGTIVYEVKLGNEFLMSSLFTEAEIQLARLGLAALDDSGDNTLDIVVGGLGLGYTAHAVLELSAVRSLADRLASPRPGATWRTHHNGFALQDHSRRFL
jgi:hypothetical protein